VADKGDSQRAIWAQRLRSRRTELNISQEELADQVHSNQATISRWENSQGEQSLELLVELARVLEASTDWLLGLTDEVGTTAHSQAQLVLQRKVGRKDRTGQ
jgi:transcriptional regulator with XRE-family HTH domain